MNQNTCNHCGADCYYIDGRRRCLACGAVMPKGFSQKKQHLFSNAFSLLLEERFDEAKTALEAVLKKYPDNADAYWGRLRARYHITYVTVADGKAIPKCPTRSGANIFEDIDYRKAMEYADAEMRDFLQTQATYIKTSCTDIVSSKNFVNRFTFGDIDPNDAFEVKPKMRLLHIELSEKASLAVKIAKVAVLSVVLILLVSMALSYWTGEVPMYSRNGLQLHSNGNGTIRVSDSGRCTDTQVEIPSMHFVLPVTSIGDWAFFDCRYLEEIMIPKTVKTIGNWAFSDCTGLTSVEIPDGATTIGAYAFDGCSNLTTIVIPDSMTVIDTYAFNGCDSLTTIRFNGTAAQWQEIDFGGNWNYKLSGYTVFCTDGTVFE